MRPRLHLRPILFPPFEVVQLSRKLARHQVGFLFLPLHKPWGKSGKRPATAQPVGRSWESGKRKHGGVFGNEGFKVPMRVHKQMEATHEPDPP